MTGERNTEKKKGRKKKKKNGGGKERKGERTGRIKAEGDVRKNWGQRKEKTEG